jgi:HTH-type transcriptional regulator, competence development regulator
MDEPSFGSRVKQLRKARGLTQRELAERVGLDFSYVSKIENDRLEHTPSVRALVRLADALQVDELELMEVANKVPPAMTAIARSPEALRFLRRATQEIEDPQGWDELAAFLDRRGRRRSRERGGN